MLCLEVFLWIPLILSDKCTQYLFIHAKSVLRKVYVEQVAHSPFHMDVEGPPEKKMCESALCKGGGKVAGLNLHVEFLYCSSCI